MKRRACVLMLVILGLPLWSQGTESKPQPGRLLNQAELEKALPATVYFSGQTATVQLRNSGGVRSADGKLTIFVMVDSGGYSSALRERYQFYILSDSAVEFDGKRLSAGAYGAGFLEEPGLIVMDLGGKEILREQSKLDPEMKRPRPLQVKADHTAGDYRLYLGRAFVVFHQLK